jgi:peptidyl-prolyl cis-trans isomerase C
MKKILFAIIAIAFIASCAKDGQKEYVAKIDNKAITKEDVQTEMSSLPDMAREFFKGAEGTARFVDELVKKELLYMEAKKRSLDKDKDLQRKIEEFKKITIINKLLEKEMETAGKVEDKDVKEFYEKNKEDFRVNLQVRLSHIVVKTEDDANKAIDRLQKGEDFAKVASEISIDKASAKSGGDIGTFKKGDLAPELEEIAMKLKKGEISRPVKLKDGIHIIKLTDAKGPIVEFDKVKGFIAQKLAADKQRTAFDKFIESLKKSYKIDVNKDAVSKLTLEPAPKPAQPQTPEKK